MKYFIDVKLTGFEEVVVEAETEAQALEAALDRFWEIYNVQPARSLRWKSTTSNIVREVEVPDELA